MIAAGHNAKPPEQGAVAVALFLGAVAGGVDLFVGSAQIAATLIVVFSFVLSLTYPRKAWLWAILTAMFVPLANTLAVELGYGHLRRPENIYITYVVFVPAFIGAYSATFLRWYSAKKEQEQRDTK
jgi:hypothetical protein